MCYLHDYSNVVADYEYKAQVQYLLLLLIFCNYCRDLARSLAHCADRTALPDGTSYLVPQFHYIKLGMRSRH
jgi:hypothetical protein